MRRTYALRTHGSNAEPPMAVALILLSHISLTNCYWESSSCWDSHQWRTDMGLDTIADGTDRFEAYLEELTSVIGHADRAGPLRHYCLGLLAAEGRKSVEPMAAVTAPASVSVQYQKMLHFVANSP